MDSLIPNSFSSDELQKLLKTAPLDAHASDEDQPADIEKLLDSIDKSLQESMDKFADDNDIPPQLVGKSIAISTCFRLIQWHMHIANVYAENDEMGTSLQWSADAGKIQSIVCILRSIKVSDEDFLVDFDL